MQNYQVDKELKLIVLIVFLKDLSYSSQNMLNEPQHETSNNVVCATSKASDQPAQSDQSLC